MKKVSSVYSKKKENITYADVKDFLCTIGPECKSNAEFSEFSNETLYTLLERRPEIVIDVLAKEKEFNTKYIYEIITRPINDSFDLKTIYSGVESIDTSSKDVKNKILKSLKKAIDKT